LIGKVALKGHRKAGRRFRICRHFFLLKLGDDLLLLSNVKKKKLFIFVSKH
jgi:hypothetical protein